MHRAGTLRLAVVLERQPADRDWRCVAHWYWRARAVGGDAHSTSRVSGRKPTHANQNGLSPTEWCRSGS
jgi:hypothetical protein